MSRNRIISFLLSVSLATGLWYLGGFVDNPTQSGFKYPFPFNKYFNERLFQFIYMYKIQIGLLFAALITILNFLFLIIPFRRRTKRLFDLFLSVLIERRLYNTNLENRCTVYQLCHGYSIFFSYIWRAFFIHGKKNYRKKLLKYYIHNIPLNPFRKYLFCFTRVGTPKIISAVFKKPAVIEEANSITNFVLLESDLNASPVLYKNLPKIDKFKNEIHESTTLKDVSSANKQNLIRRYMNKKRIKSFEQLKSKSCYPISYWASPIRKNNKTWGCIVIDSMNISKFDDIQINSFLTYTTFLDIILDS